MTTDTLVLQLEAANPVSAAERSVDAAWSEIHAIITTPTQLRSSRRIRRVAVICTAAAAVAVVAMQTLPSSLGTPTSASAAPFLDSAAKSVLTTATFGAQPFQAPQPNQFVYSETEDPSGTLIKIWLSVSGANPGLQQWTSGIKGEVPATGVVTYAPCTVAQAESSGCSVEAGYYPDMPTDPTALLAYLSQIGLVDTADQSNSQGEGWAANDLAKGLMYMLETAYLSPAQQAAIFQLMAQTPGFTLVPTMADAIGRVGEGVEWNFDSSPGALIFNPTTYALLGVRTWPTGTSANLSAPYDGNALLGITVTNALPSGPMTNN